MIDTFNLKMNLQTEKYFSINVLKLWSLDELFPKCLSEPWENLETCQQSKIKQNSKTISLGIHFTNKYKMTDIDGVCVALVFYVIESQFIAFKGYESLFEKYYLNSIDKIYQCSVGFCFQISKLCNNGRQHLYKRLLFPRSFQ